MQLICKFVPGNTLSRDVLDYILSPDECIGQLSRTRNLQDVVGQLPKPLSESLPQSAKNVLVKSNRTLFLESFRTLLATDLGLQNAVYLDCNISRSSSHLASYAPWSAEAL